MRQKLISTGLALLAPFALLAQEAADAVQPETTISLNSKASGAPVEAQDWMIVAANPLASQAGAKVPARGVISSSSARGALMTVEPLNTHCITNEAMRASNMAQKLRDAKAQLDKLSRGMNAPEHENPDDADVARISATEVGQAKL